jgi:hypothetical protein
MNCTEYKETAKYKLQLGAARNRFSMLVPPFPQHDWISGAEVTYLYRTFINKGSGYTELNTAGGNTRYEFKTAYA